VDPANKSLILEQYQSIKGYFEAHHYIHQLY